MLLSLDKQLMAKLIQIDLVVKNPTPSSKQNHPTQSLSQLQWPQIHIPNKLQFETLCGLYNNEEAIFSGLGMGYLN